MEDRIDQGSKGEVGDLSDVARGFMENVTAKGLAVLCTNCVDDSERGWLDSAGKWRSALPTKRVLSQALDSIQWSQEDTYASVAEHHTKRLANRIFSSLNFCKDFNPCPKWAHRASGPSQWHHKRSLR